MTDENLRDLDEITSFLGQCGPFQIIIFVSLSISGSTFGYMGMVMVFLADIPEHHCKQGNDSEGHTGISFHENNTLIRPDMCSRHKSTQNSTEDLFLNETEACVDGWVFSTDRYASTIVSEWDLVCDNAWKAPLSTSLFYTGVLIGSLITGLVSDRFGRKPVFFFTMAMQTFVTLIQATSTSFTMFCVLHFLLGVCQISNYITSLVLGSELLSKSARINFSILGHSLFYGIGYACLPLVAYFIRGWRMLLVASALPGFLYIPMWWVIPESPRWYLLKGRVMDAEAIIRTAAKWNKIPAPEVIFSNDECVEIMKKNFQEVRRTYSFLDLIRTTNMRNITILNVIVWTATSMTFFGISLNTGNLNGNAYLNCFISAATDIVAYISIWLIISQAPRPVILFSTLIFCGITLVIISLIPEDMYVIVNVFVFLGKLGVSGAYSLAYVFSTELLPTAVRNLGLGIFSTAARVGCIIAPYVVYSGYVSKNLPYLIFGIVSFVAAVLGLMLPDTKHCSLPDNINQAKPIKCCGSLKKMATVQSMAFQE